MKSVIFIVSSPLQKRDYVRFSIEELTKSDVVVKVFDVSKIAFPHISFNDNSESDSFDVEVFLLKSLFEVEQEVRRNGNNAVFISVGFLGKNLFQAIRSNCKEFGCQMLGPIPVARGRNARFKKLKDIIASPRDLLTKLINKVYFCVDRYDFYISVNKVGNKKTIICHCYDYNLELLNDSAVDSASERYIVFIDQMIPHHPDFKFHNIINNIDGADYYKKMDVFFSRLESKVKCEVVILAHPRSTSLDNYSDYYNGRKVYFGSSSDIISKSKFTMTHYSTAINFSVIHNKPILFLCSNEIRSLGMTEQVELMAKETCQKIVDIEVDINNADIIDFVYCVNKGENNYRDYTIKYISNRSDNDSNGKILMNELLND
ncbi:hypothetical protein [Vibrio nomapromontoriensis]|uniref:hypothetical protein n=1 Tax=Vibrio nomapromontoriensis TaxID=2910246 RepID=UPI003D1016DC